MTKVMRYLSPAKLNLFLHITGQKENGYHLLQSIFVPISLYDELIFEPLAIEPQSSKPVFSKNVDDSHSQTDTLAYVKAYDGIKQQSIVMLNNTDNLIVKAAQLLQYEALKHKKNVLLPLQPYQITLQKNIPMGAGLGGGSSNAATTLLVLNRLWNIHFTLHELAQIGLQLGADVPFFIYGQMAWVEGIGELIKPIQLPTEWYVILKPDCFISTQTVFSHPHLTRDTPKTTFCAYQNKIGQFINDCQQVVSALYPQVKDAINYLYAFGKPQLTGTGACVFLQCASKQQAAEIALNAPCYAVVAQSMSQTADQFLLKYKPATTI